MTEPAARVLIGDGSDFVRRRFARDVARAGFAVQTSATSDGFLSLLERSGGQVGLAIVDADLAPAGGRDVVRVLRGRHASLPVVVRTSAAFTEAQLIDLAVFGIAGYAHEYADVGEMLHALMQPAPAADNRRHERRLLAHVPVSYRTGPTSTAALSTNLSTHGLAIRTRQPLAAGTDARVRFKLPGAAEVCDISAHVQWQAQGRGMGLQFGDMRKADRDAILKFVALHGGEGA